MTNRYLSLLIRLWAHLPPRRRVQFLLSLGLSGVSAISEMIGLGIVFPFLAVMVSPEKVMAMPMVGKITSFMEIRSTEELLLALTAALVISTLVASAVKLLLLWVSARVSIMAAGDLSVELYRRTLFQPYVTRIVRNSSEIIAGVGTKVSHAMLFLHQTTTMLSSAVILSALIITLVAIDPRAALWSGVTFGTAYVLISRIVKKRLRRNGEILSSEAPRTVKALQEGLGGIRDVLLDGTQAYYCKLYADSNWKIRQAQAANSFINMAPRYLMEGLGVTFIAVLAYWLTLGGNVGQSALPVLGALALGAQRMLPTLQAIYGAWANILSSEASVSDTLALLDHPLPAEAFGPIPEPLGLRNCIRFESIDFSYQSTEEPVLKNINLTIKKGERIGIVGSTGSGKSTLLDILTGLLPPSSGRLVVDETPITEANSRAWRQSIAHVPQSIFLADASIAENIALGKAVADIDMDRVRRAAIQAQIADLIESRPDGYFAQVGERGVKLSGGQRQRIAIARALYKNASVLVLDEATSALDNSTEKEVMDALQKLDPGLTIVIVAHRVASVKGCERVVRVEAGKIVADGSFEAVLGQSL
jgi:ABC-type multidrug transport system fused ATPase/permease subunit